MGLQIMNLIDVQAKGHRAALLGMAARLAIGINLLGVALRIPASHPRSRWIEMLQPISLTIVLMWIIGTALVFVILKLPLRRAPPRS